MGDAPKRFVAKDASKPSRDVDESLGVARARFVGDSLENERRARQGGECESQKQLTPTDGGDGPFDRNRCRQRAVFFQKSILTGVKISSRNIPWGVMVDFLAGCGVNSL